ncbi:MAG: hypothetical protein QXH57_01655 [Sulfolobales archaeon]
MKKSGGKRKKRRNGGRKKRRSGRRKSGRLREFRSFLTFVNYFYNK